MPTVEQLIRELTSISQIPEKDADEWLSSAEKSVEFLKRNIQSDRLVLFASMPCVLIHAVLAPLAQLDPPDQDDLNHDFVMIDAAWAIEHVSGGGEPDRVYLSPPLGRHGKTLKGGEKLYFKRSFSGSSQRRIEISQKLVHALDLHFIEERNAYCRLDEDGDLEDVISVVEKHEESWNESMTLVTILAKDFAEYMRLSDMGMVIFFDFTRVRYGSFNGWSGQTHFDRKSRDLFYHGGVQAGASYVNGRMIVRPTVTYEQIVKSRIEARDPTSRQYASFKAIDLRTKERIEVSCDPKGLSNYFQKDSPLPLEMSPVFFKAEVLHKYKADPEKYDLHDRSINCRGTWSLETFDINESGQVHTYLRYLAYLPYKEQLYWQSFNEWPKAFLSERAIATDFRGEWYTEYDSLNSVKAKIKRLDEKPPHWWLRRGEDLAKAVHYPATTAPAEWANEVLALDQLLIEGFRAKEFRALARSHSVAIEAEWQSLRLIEECLVAKGMDRDDAKAALAPLRKLRELRNLLKGHAATDKRRDLEKQTRTAFGSFRAHFADLAKGCDEGLELIIKKIAA